MRKITIILILLILSFSDKIISQINVNYPFTGNPRYSYTSLNENSKTPLKHLGTSIEVLADGQKVLIEKFNIAEKNTKYKGTPFFENVNFTSCTIYQNGLAQMGELLFNIEKNQLVQFSDDNFKTLTIVRPDSFKIGNVKFVKLNGRYQDAGNQYYQEIYNDGQNQLYKLNLAKLKTPNKTSQVSNVAYPINQLEKYDGYFEHTAEYYMPNGPYFIQIRPNGKFLNSLGFFSKDLDWYVSTKKLNLKNEKDIIDFVKYYSFLIAEN